MIVRKLLTPKGWRVVANSLLVAAGIGFLCLLCKIVVGDIQQKDALSWGLLSIGMAFSLWLVVLGAMLVRAELRDWR